ncbi:CoA ester lyase [Novosphingobium flavum]|uniref:CoA ester lyase n=1 Tax=Novosphingobium aerophilum TaxID=2839843 RepID=A0A7X1F761_9SPHN|nr:CoA ester lyase [Novosphingobium aerophilum]MBC2651655.1 CoA ester lyase [Novosphingobium aerophilum]MBC2661433.1 CoA ester lyase [Novosphingobium aerophilum]
MILRSLLFVPGDRPERMAKAMGVGADALILDLEDAVAPPAKPAARLAVGEFLRAHPGPRSVALFVRVNPLDSVELAADLAALAGTTPDGVVLPKAEGAGSIRALAQRLGAIGVTAPILPVATETAAAVFQLGTYGEVADHLAGVTWGAEDLPAAIGATSAREADGSYTPVYQMVRTLALLSGHAAGVPAIETVVPDFRDLDALAAYAARARRDGFTGMMAIHPAQVPVINAAFTPSPEELDHARRVVAAFAADPGAGALQLDGRMIDAPHLKAAQRLLARGG